MSLRGRKLLLAAAESDATFERVWLDGAEAWVGRCIHCGTRVVVPLDARTPASGTLEHIVPRNHGGGDEPENLAVACACCNHSKGRRLDGRHRNDPRLEHVIALLQARRRQRLRAPRE
jgi:5-methylcytosine-specific restriction endonuclease McrA